MWGTIITLVVGIAYGYLTPGRQNKTELFKKGVLWGIVIAVVLAVLGFVFGSNPLFLTGAGGVIGFVIAAIVLVLVFILGVWIGDALESRKSRGAAPRA
ncbi:MAG: hypothetical protein LC663_03115 [Actinobacteria bacterium]|nr:hypothetical protein [Actinomycetota bacterium]